MINPQALCRKHLLGEHVEIHMLVGSVNKGHQSVVSLTEMGLLEPQNAHARHQRLVEEMTSRGYNHKSPLPAFEREFPSGSVSIDKSLKDLSARCPDCWNRMIDMVEKLF